MEDVILYNESWDIDKLSPYNTYFMEGSIGDKIKNTINKIVRFIKEIINKIRGYIANNKLNHYKNMVKNPDTAARLKQNMVAKWDSDLNIQLFDAGYDAIQTSVEYFSQIISDSSTRKVDKYIKTIENKTNIIKRLVEKTKSQSDTGEQWSEYDALCAIIEESDHASKVAFASNTLYDLMHAANDGKFDGLYGEEGVSRDKILELFVAAYEVVNEYGKGIISSTYHLRNVAERSGQYRADKAQSEIKKRVRQAAKEKGLKPKGIYRVNSVKQEYYTKGNDSMDTIIYNEKLPENIESEPEVTTESVDDSALSLEEVNAYIETTMADLKEAMDLRDQMIQEADETTDDSEHEDEPDESENVEEGCCSTATPVKESYVLDGTAIFGESFNLESDDDNTPNRFVQESFANDFMIGGMYGITAFFQTYGLLTVVNSIITSARYKKRYGRFATDMQNVLDILKESKDGTLKTKELYKALYALKDDCDTISGRQALSFKAAKNFSVTERSEIKQLSKIIGDLCNMLSKKPDKAAERRIGARIDDFVKKCETVTKLLNRGNNPGDVVKEYMS